MKVITDVTVITGATIVDHYDRHFRIVHPPPSLHLLSQEPQISWSELNEQYEIEEIKGRWFITRDRRKIMIGASREVQDLLGVYAEAYDGQENALREQQMTVVKLQNALFAARSQLEDLTAKVERGDKMGLWNRLRFVWKGFV